ncbi:unnamed protein product [Owenia fusiformis]|uniref:Large ribosomal subunit protein eL28 n=1 Tax=Owenia fusiformis TaxID=6347 RepID=A0A8S4NVH6_OWEFU|nr:unnamed protein product [Owenia fusiformis]
MAANMSEAQIARYKKIFDLFDEDGNGTISSAELGTMAQKLGFTVGDNRIKAIVNRLDLDESGNISFDEFLKAMPGLKGGAKSPPQTPVVEVVQAPSDSKPQESVRKAKTPSKATEVDLNDSGDDEPNFNYGGSERPSVLNQVSTMSADLQWMIIRNNSSFLLKGNKQTFSKEPNNLRNRNSFRYNGLVQKKTVGVEPCADGKGVVLVTKRATGWRKPAKSHVGVELKRGSRRSLNTIRKTLRNNRYRKDLKMAALRRASAILQSQKPVVVKQTRGKKRD